MFGFVSSTRAWTSLSEAETALHSHLSNHAWQHTEAQLPMGLKGDGGTCDDIRLPVRCRERLLTCGEGKSPCVAWGCMEVHGGTLGREDWSMCWQALEESGL